MGFQRFSIGTSVLGQARDFSTCCGTHDWCKPWFAVESLGSSGVFPGIFWHDRLVIRRQDEEE
jgi:hypothetical protein